MAPTAPVSRASVNGGDRVSQRSSRWQHIGRPVLLLALVATGWILGAYFDVGEHLTRDRVRALVSHAGWWGPLVFVGIFTLGELLHVPGLVFVAAAVLAWGRWPGIAASYLGALVSATAGFLFARLVGGAALERVRRPWIRRQVQRIDERPLRTVTLLRMLLWMAPALNYALGLTRVRFRHFVAGTALGLVPVLLMTGLFFDWIVRTFL